MTKVTKLCGGREIKISTYRGIDVEKEHLVRRRSPNVHVLNDAVSLQNRNFHKTLRPSKPQFCLADDYYTSVVYCVLVYRAGDVAASSKSVSFMPVGLSDQSYLSACYIQTWFISWNVSVESFKVLVIYPWTV